MGDWPAMTLGLRAMLAAAVAVALTLGSATPALGYTAQPGFSATTYATLPAGSAAGVAFIGPVMYVVDPIGGDLYSVPSAGSVSWIAPVPGGPTGLAAYGGFLYATRHDANDVVRIDPASGALTTIAVSADFSDLQLHAIAADAANGDLYITSDFGYIWRIHTPLTPTPPVAALHIDGDPYGIAIGADHSVFVTVPNAPANGVWQIVGGTPGLIATLGGARGIGVIPGYVYVNNSDGSIGKLIIPGVGTGSNTTALTGGSAGDLATIGADGCFYASQGATVVRLANANGSCDLVNTTVPPPSPTLTLANTSVIPAVVGDGSQTFSATLGNVASPGNVAVTFTVTRGLTVTTYSALTAPNGVASFGYTASSAGTDVVTAGAVVNGTPITSNAVTVVWTVIDAAAPAITYSITGSHNGPPYFACPDPALGTPGSIDWCGWYTSPPTIHFTVTPTGTTPVTYSCPDFTLTADSAGTSVICVAQNGDGVQTVLQVYLRRLMTTPTISAAASTPSGPYTGGPTSQNVTVTFTCASLPDFGVPGSTLSSCTTPVTVSAEGPTTVSGQAVNVAGTAAGTTFGPILIDKSAPVVTATMKTATDGLPYTPGTPTTQDVIVTFTCTDTYDPNPLCPAPVTVLTGPSVTVSATDWVGNTQSYTFGGIVIDRSGPLVSATVTPAPDVNGNNALSATVNITATDLSGIASITYSATGAQPIASTTATASGAPLTFTLPVFLNAIGDTTVSYSGSDALGNVTTGGSIVVHILATQPTTLTITSASSLPQGAPVTARLLAFGTTPVAGQTITFTAGAISASAVTDTNGVASATLGLVPGTYALTASFAGTTAYLASNAGPQTLTIYAPSQFVIWGGNAGGVVVGQRVVFWGEHWWDQVTLAEKAKVRDFKGWADAVDGTLWTSRGGTSKPPQFVGTYISVIITTTIERIDDKDTKAKVRGNIVGHAILRVDSPYKNDPGKPVYGVVVAVIP